MNSYSLLPFYSILFSLLSSTYVSSLGNHSRASFVTIEPGSPDNSYFVLRGSVFLLNCTVRSGFGQTPNVSWKHNDKWLFDRAKKIDDSTVQLQLLNASAHDNGIYWCGPVSGDKSQGVNISVTVADPPSCPRNLNLKIYGVYPFTDVWILWSSSSYTGGLPVNYSIKLCNDKPDNSCQKTACRLINIKECQPVNILSTTMNFKCILKTFLDACVYNISVMATNAVGSAQSLIYLPFISISSVTPKPPETFSVERTDKEGELRVRWKARPSWDLADQNYTVLYHAKGEIKNRTSTTSNKEFTLLTGLKDFTEYYVYVVVRLDESAWSEAIGPKKNRTKAGYPVNLPKVIRDYSISFPGNSGLRNVSVEWKPADTSSWRGNPGQYVISCAYHVGQREVKGCSYATDAKATNITLPRLENAHSYDVFMIMRNMEGKSSTRRLVYVIKKVQETQTTTTQERKLSRGEIAGLTISVLVGCTIAGVAVYFVRKWGRRQTPLMPLQDIQLEPPPVEYDYIAEADSKDANGDYSQLYDK
ncbi:unnamed protein product [Pocillopora meandrina]|uniref:Uncharacterized protein n=1 Tax=Pocillopora meandrina TaxID=46732 RepID=A0AAU9VP06_9CNID|nr:unnamed protein product [Pocillopora meandrina]